MRDDIRIIYADGETIGTLGGRRLRVRSVNEFALAERVADRSLEKGRAAIHCTHGGGVANRYGYPASTEAVLAVALDAQTVVLWARRLPANKVTLAGAAGKYADLYDGRTGKERTDAARTQLLIDAYRIAGRRVPRALLPAAVRRRLKEATYA